MSTPDELLFFDRAKKALESRETYDEFLKMLSLFSKDIIDSKTLIDNAQTFLGDGELLSQFKELMRWDDRQHSVEYGPPGSIRTAAPETMVVENLDEGQGYSYRRLPESVSCSIYCADLLLDSFFVGGPSGLFRPGRACPICA